MAVHFTCPSKRHEDPFLREQGVKSTMCIGHRGQCQTVGERRAAARIDTFRLTKPLQETSDMELVELAIRYNISDHAVNRINKEN